VIKARWLTDGEGAADGMRDWCAEKERGDRLLYLVTATPTPRTAGGRSPIARIYASLTVPERDAAVRLLSMEASGQDSGPEDSCNDLGPAGEPLYVLTGDTWVAVVSGQHEARDAASLLDGELQPGSLDVPSDSAVGAPCLPGS
jgi:hypothetical protein